MRYLIPLAALVLGLAGWRHLGLSPPRGAAQPDLLEEP
jgi:hypothetical protein